MADVNMEVQTPKRKYRMILDFKSQFPEKLYDVANDSYLIHWNRNGSVSVTSEDAFEVNVMKWYPGFLQIPSFLNFKRLFREYGFDRGLTDDGELEWSHPLFVRGRRELVKQIRTRRKSYLAPGRESAAEESVIIPTEKHRRYSVRKRKKTARYSVNGTENQSDLGGGGDMPADKSNSPGSYIIKPPPPPIFIGNSNQNANAVQREDFNAKKIIQNFAEKEFNEEEYYQWITKKRKLDEQKAKAEMAATGTPKDSERKSSEFWWMYENKTGGDIVQTVNLSTRQSSGPQGENCTPCGFCKCCSAISNYVHLFGEIPENIQVIDYLEEVVQTKEDSTANETAATTDKTESTDSGMTNPNLTYIRTLSGTQLSENPQKSTTAVVIRHDGENVTNLNAPQPVTTDVNSQMTDPHVVNEICVADVEVSEDVMMDEQVMEIIADNLTQELASEFVIEVQ